MTDRPTTDESLLVTRPGSGTIQRALAIEKLARRDDRLSDLLELTEDADVGRD